MADPPPLPNVPDVTPASVSIFDPWKELAASQPQPEAFQHKVIRTKRLFTSERRAKSIIIHQAAHTEISSDVAKNLRTQVLEELRLRLKRAGIKADDLGERFFAWLLPKNNANVADWSTFINKPYLVSNVTLSSMISMMRCTPATPAPAGRTRVFYVRTFAFTLDEVLELIQAFFDEDLNFDFPYALIAALQDLDLLEDANVPIFIRYCGTTRDSVLNRQRDDMKKTESSLINIFLNICMLRFPHIITAAEIHELVDGALDFQTDLVHERIAGVREQALIALFDQSTLLNSAMGGFGATFQPNLSDDDEVSQTNSRTLSGIGSLTEAFVNTNALTEYSQNLQKYCLEHPHSTNTALYPFTNEFREFMYQQALPVLVGKHTPMVTIAADVPPDTMTTLLGWYSGGAGSSKLAVDIMEHIAKCELGYTTTADIIIDRLSKAHQLPFVDLYPWPAKAESDVRPALGFLRQYLQAVSPIITLTMSSRVSGVAIGAFHQPHGIKYLRMNDEVGRLFLSKYGDDPSDTNPEKCCIVIPCFHPGSVRYNSAREKLILRVIHKTLAIAWLAFGEAAHIARDDKLSKREICKRVIAAVDAKTGPSTIFGTTFTAIKKELLKTYDTSTQAPRGTVARLKEQIGKEAIDLLASPFTTKVSTGISVIDIHKVPVIQTKSIQWKRALPELRIILDCGRSVGTPGSDSRRAQVEGLVGLSLANLRTAAVGGSEDDLRAWALQVTKGRLYYIEATSLDERAHDVPNLLSIFAAGSSAWRDNATIREVAGAALEAWLTESFVDDEDNFENIVKQTGQIFEKLFKNLEPNLFATTQPSGGNTPQVADLFTTNGQSIVIKPPPPNYTRNRPTLQLAWDHNGQVHKIDNFMVPTGCQPVFASEIRTIHFVESGIDIRDGAGISLGIGPGRNVSCPFPYLITMLENNPLADDFFALWERVTGLSSNDAIWGAPQAHDAVTGAISTIIPENFYAGRTLPYDISNTRVSKAKKKEALEAQLPFQPGDAGWLVNRFLEVKYPNGGTLDLAAPNKFPEVNSAWTQLEAFLREPRYSKHPHRNGILAAIRLVEDTGDGGLGKGSVSYMSILVGILRPGSTVKLREGKLNALRKRKTRTVVELTTTIPGGVVVRRPEPFGDVVAVDQPGDRIVGDDEEEDAIIAGLEPEDDDDDDDNDDTEKRRKVLADQRRRAAAQTPARRTRSTAFVPALGEDDEDDEDDHPAASSSRRRSTASARKGTKVTRQSGMGGPGSKSKDTGKSKTEGKKRAKEDSSPESKTTTTTKKARKGDDDKQDDDEEMLL